MRILEKYNADKTYMFPTGKLATPEVVAEQYPATSAFTFVVVTDERGEVLMGLDNLSALRSGYNIDPALSEAEAILAIQGIMNAPLPEPEPQSEHAPQDGPLASALMALADAIKAIEGVRGPEAVPDPVEELTNRVNQLEELLDAVIAGTGTAHIKGARTEP